MTLAVLQLKHGSGHTGLIRGGVPRHGGSMGKEYGGGYREAHANGQSHGAEQVVEREQAAYLMESSSMRTAPSRSEYSGLHGKWRQPSWPSAKVQRPVLKKRLHLT